MRIPSGSRFPDNIFGRCAGLLVLSTLLYGCSTSTPEPVQTTRTAADTAPADLQLLCADAAAKETGAASGTVLPVTSRRAGPQTYQVELNVNGASSSCIIDEAGNVVSLQQGVT